MYYLLASTSPMRQKLLHQTGVPFSVIATSLAAETIDHDANAEKNTFRLSQEKAATYDQVAVNTILDEHQRCCVIAADTLIENSLGQVFGKPRDRAEADLMLDTMLTAPIIIATSVTLLIFEKDLTTHQVIQRTAHSFSSVSTATFIVPPEQRDAYFTNAPEALFACGACVAEDYAAQFLRSFSGCYAGALGLPVGDIFDFVKKFA